MAGVEMQTSSPMQIHCSCRTTVWKDMVEKERKRQSATVDDDSTEEAKPWYKSRAFCIALSIIVFAVLLSKSSSLYWSRCLLCQRVHLQVSPLQGWQKRIAYRLPTSLLHSKMCRQTPLLLMFCMSRWLHPMPWFWCALHSECSTSQCCPPLEPRGPACCACCKLSRRPDATPATPGHQTTALCSQGELVPT